MSEGMHRFNALKQLPTQEAQDKANEQMRKDSLLMQERLFIGQTYDKEMGLFIKDQDAPRIKIFIDKHKQPQIPLLNTDGSIIH